MSKDIATKADVQSKQVAQAVEQDPGKVKQIEGEYTERVFKYEHHVWKDPGKQYGIEDIRNSLAEAHPAIRQATVKQEIVDGKLEVTFIKKATTKGGGAEMVNGYDSPDLFAGCARTFTFADAASPEAAVCMGSLLTAEQNRIDAENTIDVLELTISEAIDLLRIAMAHLAEAEPDVAGMIKTFLLEVAVDEDETEDQKAD